MNKVFVLQKGKNHILVLDENDRPILKQSEIDCQCESDICRVTLISQDLIASFEKTRLAFGSPIKITSGFRCQPHNLLVGGVKDSNHTKGNALDLKPLNGDLDALELEARNHFRFVLRYPTFIHCDNRLNKKLLK